MPTAKSLISMDKLAAKVSMISTKFWNFMFLDGIITNTHERFDKSFVHNNNIHTDIETYNCQSINPQFGECHSVMISDCLFDSYMRGGVFAALSNTLSSTKGVEAFVGRFRSLNGPIHVRTSTFKNILAAKSPIFNSRALEKDFCRNSAHKDSSIDLRTAEQPARLIKKISQFFKMQYDGVSDSVPLSISSCFDIRDLRKGLVMYQNTFEKILSTAAPALSLYNFQNTLGKMSFMCN